MQAEKLACLESCLLIYHNIFSFDQSGGSLNIKFSLHVYFRVRSTNDNSHKKRVRIISQRILTISL